MKKIVLVAASAAVLATLSACSCWSPINDSCVEVSHKYRTAIAPSAVSFNQTVVLPTKDVFRPTFSAGTTRISAIGNGDTREQALNDAVSKLCLENNCDMIAAAKAVIVRTSHPYWFFFNYKTYRVHLSGLPLTMTGLVKEMAPAPASEQKVADKEEKITKEDIVKIFTELLKVHAQAQAKPQCVPAMITLSDIRLNMTAAAQCDSKVAVKLPAKCVT